jgi:CubicO group peptidase (beta-lactamase class C family)
MIVFLLGVLYINNLFAQTVNNNDVAMKVDALFADWDNPNSPGCALAVIKDGTVLYTRGYGMADMLI